MSTESSKLWFHRFAIATVFVAMVTVTFGALTTSKNAGMAFRDWPTSDGQPMLTYPWFSDFAKNWDKFLEHGHRLSGALIGMWSISLVSLSFATRQSRTVKILSCVVLLGVICQGLLGGFRVQLDERGLAMLHGAFAALVVSLMGIVALITSPAWSNMDGEKSRGTMRLLQVIAALLIGILVTQYFLGGLIRHRGTGLHEHLILGFGALALIFANWIFCSSSTSETLQRSSLILLAFAGIQVGLGLGAWVTRFGFAPVGYVAVYDSIQQVLFRTAHTVCGIVIFQYTVVHVLRVFRVAAISEFTEEESLDLRNASQIGGHNQLAVEGGGQ